MMPTTSASPSANCLLKTLEEPPPSSLLILIGTSPSRQLPTIRSRSQIVRFRPLASGSCRPDSVETGAVADREQAAAAGRAQRRQRRAGACNWPIRRCGIFGINCSARCRRASLGRRAAGPAVQAFVDEAGKEASLSGTGCGSSSALRSTFTVPCCDDYRERGS